MLWFSALYAGSGDVPRLGMQHIRRIRELMGFDLTQRNTRATSASHKATYQH
jgi:hypothetical protein